MAGISIDWRTRSEGVKVYPPLNKAEIAGQAVA